MACGHGVSRCPSFPSVCLAFPLGQYARTLRGRGARASAFTKSRRQFQCPCFPCPSLLSIARVSRFLRRPSALRLWKSSGIALSSSSPSPLPSNATGGSSRPRLRRGETLVFGGVGKCSAAGKAKCRRLSETTIRCNRRAAFGRLNGATAVLFPVLSLSRFSFLSLSFSVFSREISKTFETITRD